MPNTQWSSFANQHAMVTIANLVLGALISFICRFHLWPIGIYSIVLGFIILLLEYPRSARPKDSLRSSVHIRPYQHYLGIIYSKLGLFYSNYITRFFIYIALSIPCFFTLSTIIPAFNLIITAFLYLFSNFKKEKWIMVERTPEKYQAGVIFRPPERPPPRNISDISNA